MPASLTWRPVDTPDGRLPVNAPSSFIGALTEAFGYSAPWRFTHADLAVLRGLRAGLAYEHAAIDRIMQAIGDHNEIIVEVG